MSSHNPVNGPSFIREVSDQGTVVAPHEQGVVAGLRMYELGGNAVDAAVAAALVEAVIDPASTTLGGSGFCLIGLPEGEPVAVEFGPKASQQAHAEMFELDTERAPAGVSSVGVTRGDANVSGPLSIGVPRTLLGLLTAQERYGILTRSQVLAPAVAVAADGFPADDWLVRMGLLQRERLIADPYLKKTFLDEENLPLGSKSGSFQGSTVDAPVLVRQPTLARTLEDVAAADSLDILTTGAIARSLLQTLRERGAIISDKDLATAGPEIGAPLHRKIAGHEVHVPKAPTGGITVLQKLLIWEAMGRADAKWYDSGATLREMASAFKHAFADRYHWLGDPDRVNVPVDAILSEDYARHLARVIVEREFPRTKDEPWVTYGSAPLHNPTSISGEHQQPWGRAEPHSSNAGTTHVSASDPSGMIVAITHTNAQPFGAAVACPRTGLLFDAAMAWFNPAPGSANSISAGARPLCNMAPVLLFGRERKTALGASGGRRIIGAVAEILMALIYNDEHPTSVLNRPRFDASGRRLILNDRLRPLLSGGEQELDAAYALSTNELYAHDFARANLASWSAVSGELVSAIDPFAFSH